MLILDRPRPNPEQFRFIAIPHYHRPHLGLAPNRTAYVSLLPSPSSASIDLPLPELIISGYQEQEWQQLWRLTIFLRERPGLVRDVAETFESNQINIVATETSVILEQDLHKVEVVFKTEEQAVPWLDWTLQARLAGDLAFARNGEPRLHIEPLHDLREASKAFAAYRPIRETDQRQLLFSPLHDNARTEFQETEPGRHELRVRLPNTMRDALTRVILDKGAEKPEWGYHLRISDSHERIMRVLFFRSTDPVLFASIEHNDEIGALATITRALSERDFTLLTALHVPAERDSRAVVELVAYAANLKGSSSADRKEALEQALSHSAPCAGLDLRISYPNNYRAPQEWKDIQSNEPSERTPEPDFQSFVRSLREATSVRYDAMAQQIQRGIPILREEANQWNLVNKLSVQYQRLSLVPSKKALFVSCHYAGEQLRSICEEAIKPEYNFSVFTGEHLEGFSNKVEGLVERIRSCTHFLGVWLCEGALELGEQRWPTPWLLWELGIAEALGLQWRLLIERGIAEEAWRRIYEAQQHVLCHSTEFEKKLEYTLKILSLKDAGVRSQHHITSPQAVIEAVHEIGTDSFTL